MSDFTNQIGRMTLLPSGARDFLRRRLIEAGGCALIALGVVYWAALMSFHRTDPSLNNATDSRALNLLGRPGAILADLALQSLGLAGFILSIVLIVWGWRVMRLQRQGRWWLRLLLLPFVLVMTAVALAALPKPTNWPLASGLGGATGAMIMDMLGRVTDVSPAALGSGVGLLAAAALFFALGVPVRAYVHTVRRLRDLSDRMAGLLLRLYGRLRSKAGGDGATLRAERSHQQRLERQEPQFDRDDAEDVAIAPPPATRSAEPRATGAPLVAKPAKAKTGKKAAANQATLDLVPDERYDLPPLDLLDKVPSNAAVQKINDDSLQKNARLLESVLEDFGVKGEIVQVRPGPVVTLYELEPAPGTKTSRVVGLADDVARSMSAVSVRIAVVPGRSVIGIEMPNRVRETVYLRELLESEAFERTAAKLALVFGKDIGGGPVIVDLARMPHLLIAGTTGSGKSVAINTMILSLIYRLSPDACKFIMIDPKMLELSVYDGIPHLLAPVVTEPRKAIVALKWTVREMEQRYRAMSKLGVRNIEGYNLRIAQARDNGETLTRKVQTGFDPETGAPIYEEEPIALDALPLIVVVVDEMADLMLVAGKDIEAAIQRLAQMARAAGIHIIMATQRPSVDVITGTIKANFPTRVSFHVTSRIDSRTILGETGAEQLLGQGDMLYMANGGRITRVHGPLVTDREVEAVVRFLKDQGEPTYIEDVTREEDEPGVDLDSDDGGSGDALYDEAVAIVCRERKASTSFIQRHLQIGYNRAARIIERMEKEGVVSEANRVGKREVLARNIDGNE
ncbi:MAG TPA: DNA translocase FtsK 4TM domain-containing protein [Candidatus Angelobacter sp.]|nr:DNA translocase FtsK 4TM domain-containing protein [Candidatus Angelobacter sp.]